ncbi:MAG TPA: lysophospholipid acyltransferase family protein [Steroidobacteraceae bacterium]|jgi:lauroyl/myristoyl acyltransferase
MVSRARLTAGAFAAVDLVVAGAGPLLAEQRHAGRRACRELRDLRDAPSGPYFARDVLAARWRSALLLRYAMQLTRPRLRTFLEDRVSYEGAAFAQHVFNGNRPVILAAPHYGAAPVGFLAAFHRMRGRTTLNLFYDVENTAPQFTALFEHGGVDANRLLGGFPGVVAAMRALTRNEWLVMMPDAFDDLAHTLAVPFYGRMLRVAPGTAFFALRTGAWIVPVFAAPLRRLGVHVTVGRPLDPHRFEGVDEPQAIFMLTRALFASFEREIRRAPEHWHNWEVFPRVSTAVQPPGRLEDDSPLRLLKDLCEASPHLLQDVPELELLVR